MLYNFFQINLSAFKQFNRYYTLRINNLVKIKESAFLLNRKNPLGKSTLLSLKRNMSTTLEHVHNPSENCTVRSSKEVKYHGNA